MNVTSFQRIEIPVEEFDLLSVLALEDADVKVYWSDQDAAFSCAGWGQCLLVRAETVSEQNFIWEHFAKAKSDSNIRFYGGFAFDPTRRDPHWDALGAATFVLPRFELVRRGEKTFFCVNFCDEKKPEEFEKVLEGIKRERVFEASLPVVQKREYEPQFPTWKKNVDGVLEEIYRKVIEKVVLTRETSFTFASDVDACAILKELEKLAPRSSRFLFQFSKGTAFFGASPEKLYRRKGQEIVSAAVAGTRPRGKNPTQDQGFKEELGSSSKEKNEHTLVVKYIQNQLQGICDGVQFSQEPQILTLNHAYHLMTTFEGQLKSSVSDKDIFIALHPTPAVCGVPQERARECIRKHEAFSRGWFAGAVGCVGADVVDFVVAIRSALVTGNVMRVFAGAGIVEGSVAQNEWEEIDHKIDNLLKVIKVKGN